MPREPYTLEQDGAGWLLVGPTMPREEGNWYSEHSREHAEAHCRELNAAWMAGYRAGKESKRATRKARRPGRVLNAAAAMGRAWEGEYKRLERERDELRAERDRADKAYQECKDLLQDARTSNEILARQLAEARRILAQYDDLDLGALRAALAGKESGA